MPTKHQQQVCDSKIKHSEISAKHSVQSGQDYYECKVCKSFHIFTVQKVIPKKVKINHKFKLRKLRHRDS